jgi:hypothetical protein
MTDTEIIQQVMAMTIQSTLLPENEMKDELVKIGAWGIIKLSEGKS